MGVVGGGGGRGAAAAAAADGCQPVIVISIKINRKKSSLLFMTFAMWK